MLRICGNCIYWDETKVEPAICKECCKGRNDKEQAARKYFYPRELECEICGDKMIFDYNKRFYRCVECGSEYWPYVTEIDDDRIIREDFEKHLQCARDKRVGEVVIHVKSQVKSGSKSRKKRNKNLLQKPSQTQIYNKLAAEPNDSYNQELARKQIKTIAK